MKLRTHKGFSEIEQDIQRFYEDGTASAATTALKVAGRALSIAMTTTTGHPEYHAIERARQIVFDLLLDGVDR
jgi:hypothetical protein